jgi:hypothetical protein
MIVPISFLAIILGWSMAALYAVIPVSKTNRRRGMIRALVPIFGGMSGLSAEAHSEAWTEISIAAMLGAALLAFLPFKWGKVGSEHFRTGTMVVLKSVPPGLLEGLPEDDQTAISEIIGKPVHLVGYDDSGKAELQFTDRDGATHSIWVDTHLLWLAQ